MARFLLGCLGGLDSRLWGWLGLVGVGRREGGRSGVGGSGGGGEVGGSDGG